MPLATQDDVRSALRRDLTENEADWIADLIDEASDLVTGYLYPYPIPHPTPLAITRVVAAMAAAVLNRPASILPDTQSLSADSFGVTFAADSTSPGPRLTAPFKERLKPFRTGVVAMALDSERS